MKINIAIDGPSAAGKSTVARVLAKELNYVHLDTGAMYRCTAYKALKNKLDLTNEREIMEMLYNTEIKMSSDGGVYLDGIEVKDILRTDEISMGASLVSKLEKVRAYLVNLQQKMAQSKGYIMDGRDIGTVVLKDAELKIFLVADSIARANRRHEENLSKGFKSDLQLIIKEIKARDKQDSERKHSPLKKAEDAVEIDSSDLSIDEVVKVVFNEVDRVMKECKND